MQTSLIPQEKEFDAERPTHTVTVHLDGTPVQMYAMKGIPLIFEGNFRNTGGAFRSEIRVIKLSGDIKPTSGVVKYNDINISNIPFVDRAHIRGVMSQSQTIVFDFSVLEIIEMGWLHSDHDYYTSFYPDVLKQIIEDC